MIAFFVLVLASFALFYAFMDMANAPSEFVMGQDSSNGGSSGIAADAVGGPAAGPSGPDGPGANTVVDGYIAMRLGPSDISLGNLIVVNHDFVYEIREDHDLVLIEDMKTMSYRVSGDNLLFSRSAIGKLNEMMDAFFDESERDSTTIISAFRDFERQQEILDEYVAIVGRTEALRWASPPGYSEHHTGLAVDLGFFSGGEVRTFLGTGINAWFSENSYKFGFILRYPFEKSDITKTAYEPWHFRYVGNPHAYVIHNYRWCLEEYIGYVMGFSREEPFSVVFDGDSYDIYFTRGFDVLVPVDSEYDISGNNIDGFIVTVKR